MAAAKRGRPAFSPPRPRKTTSASKTKSNNGNSTSKTSSSTTTKRTTNSVAKSKKAKTKSTVDTSRRRSRLVSSTPSASDSLGGSDDGNELMSVDAEDDNDEDDEDDNTHATNQRTDDSPEPDFILAEISYDPGSSEPTIPLGLVHRILHSQFAEPEKTKISTDAREVVGKYIETFVREAIARCAFEKTSEDQDNTHPQQSDGGGWLEVDDLEKVAVQLCLDF